MQGSHPSPIFTRLTCSHTETSSCSPLGCSIGAQSARALLPATAARSVAQSAAAAVAGWYWGTRGPAVAVAALDAPPLLPPGRSWLPSAADGTAPSAADGAQPSSCTPGDGNVTSTVTNRCAPRLSSIRLPRSRCCAKLRPEANAAAAHGAVLVNERSKPSAPLPENSAPPPSAPAPPPDQEAAALLLLGLLPLLLLLLLLLIASRISSRYGDRLWLGR